MIDLGKNMGKYGIQRRRVELFLLTYLSPSKGIFTKILMIIYLF